MSPVLLTLKFAFARDEFHQAAFGMNNGVLVRENCHPIVPAFGTEPLGNEDYRWISADELNRH